MRAHILSAQSSVGIHLPDGPKAPRKIKNKIKEKENEKTRNQDRVSVMGDFHRSEE